MVGQSLLSWAKFTNGKPKSATLLWLIKPCFSQWFHCIALHLTTNCKQLLWPTGCSDTGCATSSTSGWPLLIAQVTSWATYLQTTAVWLRQTTITQRKFANTHCLVYKCRQIANALQSVWVGLRQWAQLVSNTSLCSRRPDTSGWKMVVWSLIYGRSCPLNLYSNKLLNCNYYGLF